MGLLLLVVGENQEPGVTTALGGGALTLAAGVDEGGWWQVRCWSRVGRRGAAAAAAVACDQGHPDKAEDIAVEWELGVALPLADWEGGTGRPSADWGRRGAMDR